MSELFNVNTFIVSQVNPHVVPFVSHDGGGILESRMRRRFISTFKAVFGNEVKHLLTQLITLGLVPLPLQRMSYLITQSYKGNVTIVPQTKLKHYKNILVNPSSADYEQAIQSSYNSTL
jgi:TAG lipase / steryl ester hydrolase / phospholipase A2 / LPA acyltransferase